MSKSKDKISFFPGCALKSVARENYEALMLFCDKLGIVLDELYDWNCCGTTSSKAINSRLALELAVRNIYLAKFQDSDILLAACPSCYLKLNIAKFLVKNDHGLKTHFEESYKGIFPEHIKIISLIEYLDENLRKIGSKCRGSLNGVRFVSYYGCMFNLPPFLKGLHGFPLHTIERLLSLLGAEPVLWSYGRLCCGTFISLVNPEFISSIVDKIFSSAMNVKAECIVTVCSMCHLNLELRCSLREKIPVFHLSEMLALSVGVVKESWFKKHLINPFPFLKEKGFLWQR